MPPSEELFGPYIERWLRDIAAGRVRNTTLESYGYVARHAIAALGDRPLATIRPIDIQALYTALLQRGLSTSTISSVHNVIRQSLADAVNLAFSQPTRQIASRSRQ